MLYLKSWNTGIMEWLAFASSESYFLLKLSTKCRVFGIYHSFLRHIVYSCLATLATPSGKRRSSTSNSLKRLTQRKNKRILFEAIWLGVRLFHRCLFTFCCCFVDICWLPLQCYWLCAMKIVFIQCRYRLNRYPAC